jgi:hypothetical protein
VTYLFGLLGQPTARAGGVLGWRLIRPGYVHVPRRYYRHHARKGTAGKPRAT